MGTIAGLLTSDVSFANLSGATILAGVSAALTVVAEQTVDVTIPLTAADTDGDGFDPWELQHFNNLSQTATGDFDGDSLPNGYEFTHGFNPTLNDANADADGDGATNIQEFRVGTDPKDPASHPSRAMPWIIPLLLE